MQRTVTVTGRGSAPAVPDSAVVRAAASCAAPSVAEAVAGVGEVGATVQRVARLHVDARHVASTGLQVWPRLDPAGRPDGFEASHQVQVRCPDLEVASRVLHALAEEAGDALRVDAVQPEVSDPRAAQDTAREAAWADARARAEHLATLAGATLGDVLQVEEGDGAPGGVPSPRMAVAASVVLEPGERAVGAAVTVTWQLV